MKKKTSNSYWSYHLFISLPNPTKNVRSSLNKDIFEFIWKSRSCKNKRSLVTQVYSSGGWKCSIYIISNCLKVIMDVQVNPKAKALVWLFCHQGSMILLKDYFTLANASFPNVYFRRITHSGKLFEGLKIFRNIKT